MSNETQCPTCKGDGCKAERSDAPLTLEPPHWMGPAPCGTCHGNGVVVEEIEQAKVIARSRRWPSGIKAGDATIAAAGRMLADRCDELESQIAELKAGQ